MKLFIALLAAAVVCDAAKKGGGGGGGGGGPCDCVPPSQCRQATAGVPLNGCSLADGSAGVCCTRLSASGPVGSLPGLISPQQGRLLPPDCTPAGGGVPELHVEIELAKLLRKEASLKERGLVARGAIRGHRHLQIATPAQQAAARRADIQIKEIKRCVLNGNGGTGGGEQPSCPEPSTPECPSSPSFRTADGSCNNPTNRRLGMAGEAMLRLLPSRYQDGVSEPRSLQSNGTPLPSTRLVSSTVIGNTDAPDNRFTLSNMQWGQFLDHDLVMTPVFSLGKDPIKCCGDDGKPLSDDDRHEKCLHIPIPADDPFYGPLDVTCMDFVRSLPADVPECGATLDMQQKDVVTHFLDGSQIYGSSADKQAELREHSGGRVRMTPGELLSTDESTVCHIEDASQKCFEAGDKRVNEQVGLTLTHTIWVREHNRVAAALAAAHSDWDDERLYQEARRIVIAELQHINYNEYLPTLLDLDLLAGNELLVDNGGEYSTKYRSDVAPLITNEFTTAAFRFGHSQITGTIELFNSLGVATSSVMLRDVFFDPHLLYDPQRLTELARGLAAQRSQALDGNFPTDVHQHMFQPDGKAHGLDLVSLNIQRGRDHAIGTYNDARAATGQARATSWDDLRGDMSDEAVTALSSVYASVDDVDLFIGGILERHLPNVVLGKTFGRLILDQFIRVRHGDNFFYDLGGEERPWRLSGPQLEQVRRASWARVICDNVADVTRIQPLAFLADDAGTNAVTDCGSDAIPRVDLGAW